MESPALRVLLKRSPVPGRWAAICVDHYMVAEGDSPKDAVCSLDRVVRVERDLGNGSLVHLPVAPYKYRVAYATSAVPTMLYEIPDSEVVANDKTPFVHEHFDNRVQAAI